MNAINQAYEYPLAAALAHKQEGGKVVGYVSTAVPCELIAASGAFPVMIRGDVQRSTRLADEWMEEQFDPMARSIFDMALAGDLQFLDLLIVPRVADSFMRLYLYLREVERLGLATKLPRLLQFDLLQSQFRTSEEYNLARIGELRDELRKLCGRAITDEALSNSIKLSNENRAACRELLALRNAERMAGSTVLRAIGARFAMRIEEHTRALKEALPSVSSRQTAGIRVLVSGNAQDNALLYEYLESQGFSIAGDYHWLGDNCCSRDLAIANDPLASVAEHYHKYSLTSRRFPQSSDELLQLSSASGAAGVIFFLFSSEEALSWDVPGQSRDLEQAGVPTLILDDQPYGPRIDAALQSKVDAFKSRLRP
jgi:benzoyl-CoA reductase/2-hydroxyglutaryl-CoA dehydratase subunit BcrC/BadD/HgdB